MRYRNCGAWERNLRCQIPELTLSGEDRDNTRGPDRDPTVEGAIEAGSSWNRTRIRRLVVVDDR